MSKVDPFLYPVPRNARKHGPRGYADYSGYRPWLRDEFVFRCAYCLSREAWGRLRGGFDLDHFEAQVLRPELAHEYENLVYSCHGCNLVKGTSLLRVPSRVSLRVEDNGIITPLDDDGERVVDLLGLDDFDYTRFRRLIIGIIRAVSGVEDETFIMMMGFPIHNLPDLGTLKPPQGNSRPEGLAQSWNSVRERGELPAYYE